MNLCEKFLELYKMSDMTYSDLSDASGISTATISRIINGGTTSVENIELLIKILEDRTQHTEASSDSTATDDPNASAELQTLPAHCQHCRSESRRHNDAMREDFSARFAMMKEIHEKQLYDMHVNYEQSIAELKAAHEREINLHERAKTYLKRRFLITSIFLWVVLTVIFVLCVIDLTNGSVGWHRFANGWYTDHLTGITKYMIG